jgi:hypothetical protein
MVLLNNGKIVVYNRKEYVVLNMKKRINIPVVIDKKIYDFVKNLNMHFYLNDNFMVYTKFNNGNKLIDIYLHEIVKKINNPIYKYKPILHINKINVDNRIDNLIYDTTNKDLTKNLNKKNRIIDLSDDGIDVDTIPSFVWYLNGDDSHGDRFIVELGPIKWKSTSSTKLSLRYKLEEIKKFLRMHRNNYPNLFKEYSMNGDLNDRGLKLKIEYYDIIQLAGYPYKFEKKDKTYDFFEENYDGLSKLEIQLLKEFDINSKETTNDRLKRYLGQSILKI